MKYMVTGREMAQYDKNTSEQLQVPSAVLMEQAAMAFVNRFCELFSLNSSDSVLIVCGTGNNGGDGIAIARLLQQRGITTDIYAPVHEGAHTSELYKLQKKIYCAHEYPEVTDDSFNHLLDYSAKECTYKNNTYDYIIDAVFGTGLSRNVTGMWANIIEQMNNMSGHKVAVDISSGVSADTGEVLGTAFRADDTITFSFLKCGQVFSPGSSYSGNVSVVPIGITEKSFFDLQPRARYLTHEDLFELPSRRPDSHKGSYGRLLVIAGSPQMAGAAVFAASAAYHMGTGLVKILTPEENRIILQTKIPEAILSVYGENTDEKQLEKQLSEDLQWADALVIGPGLGTGDTAYAILRQVLTEAAIPMVLDADALNLLAKEPALLTNVIHRDNNDTNIDIISNDEKISESFSDKIISESFLEHDHSDIMSASDENACLHAFEERRMSIMNEVHDIIITPHLGEMSRLTGLPTGDIKQHLMDTAAEFAAKHQVVCVLKDAHTVTAFPDGRIYVNMSGNNGMATAGSGDVLAGILGGMLAQGLPTGKAAPLGVYFHGLAGDAAKKKLGAHYMLASDIVEGIENVFEDYTP